MDRVIKDIEFIQEVLKINNKDFCDAIGIARSTLNRWQKNETIISKSQKEALYSYAYNNDLRLNELKAQMYEDNCSKGKKILFHGTKNYFDGDFNLSFAEDRNDMGKAIYFGDNIFQSTSWVSNYNNSYIYICEYDTNAKLNIINYGVEEDWMLTVAYFRGRLGKYKNNKKIDRIINKYNKADLIVAPIADNQVFTVLDKFFDGDITDKQCMKSLSATNLGKQFCFLNKKALSTIKIKEKCYLCQNEKIDILKRKYEENNISMQKSKYAMREFAGKGLYIEDYFK